MHIYIINSRGTNQNSVGFQILPVAIRTGISPEEIKIAISASDGVMHLLFTRMPGESYYVKARVGSLSFPSLSSAS